MSSYEFLRQQTRQRAEACKMTKPADKDLWISGLPLGNGDMGVMVWGDGGPLKLTLDKTDLWDTRMVWPDEPDLNYVNMRKCAAEGDWERFQWLFEDSIREVNPLGPTKISFGRLEISLADQIDSHSGELSLFRGVAELKVEAADGTDYTVTAFVHKQRNVLCLRIEPMPQQPEIRLLGLAETNPHLAELDSYSPQQVDTGPDGGALVQQIPEGISCAAAWSVAADDTLFLTMESAADRQGALARAADGLADATKPGWKALLAEHEAAWADYWDASGIAVPDEKIEHLWHLGTYMIGSAAKPGCLPPGLQGVWALDGEKPPWHGDYHADMNVQETFWPVYPNNHLELGRCLTDFLMDCLPAAQKFCRSFFGWEGAFFPCAFAPGMVFVPGWSTAQFWAGVPGWLAHHLWLQWQYERDEALLREQVVPFLRSVFQFYEGLLEAGDDGKLHVPLSASPEIDDNKPSAWCSDPNCDLSIIRNLCRWLIQTEAAAGDAQFTSRAECVAANLADYAINDEGGLMLWPGRDYNESHRHPSHVMCIHPFDDINVDGGEEALRIIERSMWELINMGMSRWGGHTYPQTLALAARAERGNMAAHQAHIFHDNFIWKNGLHVNGDYRQVGYSIFAINVFCMEANCGIAGTIPEMLLQSWGGRIRIFPAVPDEWQDACFRKLRAEGGWVVSAQMEGGQTTLLEIKATAPGTCRIKNPFADGYEADAEVVEDGEDLVVELAAGQEATFRVL